MVKSNKPRSETSSDHVYRRILGVVGLIAAGFLCYVERDAWKFNNCATEGWATVEAVTRESIAFRFNERIVTRTETRRPTDYFKVGDEALIAYCEEDGGLIVYNYHKWNSNCVIVFRTIFIIAISSALFIKT